jgi:hypothetical protein
MYRTEPGSPRKRRLSGLSFHSVWAKFFASNLHMRSVRFWLLVALHRFQNFKAHIISGTGEVLSPVYDPLESTDEENDPEGNDAVI